MNAAKHTPGPWRIAGLNLQGLFTNDGAASIVTDDGPVASVACQTPFKRGSGSTALCAERDANARLIVAAPELLAELDIRGSDLVMLRLAIEAGDPKSELLVRVDDMLRETRAAIAKAEGKP